MKTISKKLLKDAKLYAQKCINAEIGNVECREGRLVITMKRPWHEQYGNVADSYSLQALISELKSNKIIDESVETFWIGSVENYPTLWCVL